MAKLAISPAQKTTVVDAVDTHLQNAFAEGVEVLPSTPVLDPMQFYATRLTSPMQTQTKDTFRLVVAALIKVLGITGPLTAPAFQAGGLTTAITYKKSDGVTNGTLTFTNGILTGSV